MSTSVGKLLSVGVLGAVIGAAVTYLVMADASEPESEAEPVSRSVPSGDEGSATRVLDTPPTTARMEGGPAGGVPAKRADARAIARLIDEAKANLPASVPGKITGTVRTPDGRPLAGAVLRAHSYPPAESQLAHSRGVVPAVESPEESVRRSVRYAKWAAESNREARTDSSGAYVLENLFDMEYYVIAYADGYEVQPATSSWAKTRPGGSVDWFARPLVPVTILVVKPDGSTADEATVTWTDPKRGGGSGAWWRPGAPELRLEPGTWSVHAAIGEEMRSPPAVVTPGTTPQPVTLRLEVRNRLHGKVGVDPADNAWNLLWLTLRPVSPAEGVNPLRTNARPPDWSFRFEDVAPGDYELTAGVDDGGGAVSQRVRVEGHVTRDLVLPRLTAAHVLEVRVVGPEGAPVDRDDVSFTIYEREPNNSARGSGARYTQRPDGAFLVAVKSPWVEHRDRMREERARGAVAGGPPLPPEDADPKGPFRTSVRVQLKAGGQKEVEFVPGETTRVEVSFR